MRKDKSEQHNNEIEHFDEEPILEDIRASLQKMDDAYPVTTPELSWFEHMIEVEQLQLKKKFRKDLLIFFSCVLIIIGLVIITLIQAPLIFLFLQVMVTCFIPIYVYLQQKNSEKII